MNATHLFVGIWIVTGGCTEASEPPTLESLGIAKATFAGDRYSLFDRDGIAIGSVQLGGDATIEATLRGAAATTNRDGSVTCNGTTLLAPCADALRAEISVLASYTAPASPTSQLEAGCIYLGSNGYCDGGWWIEFNDWLCGDQIYESVSYLPGRWVGCPVQ